MPVADTVSEIRQIDKRSSLRVETDDGVQFRAVVEDIYEREADRWNDPEIDIQLAVVEEDAKRLGMAFSTAYITTTATDREFDGVHVDISVDVGDGGREVFERVGELKTVERTD